MNRNDVIFCLTFCNKKLSFHADLISQYKTRIYNEYCTVKDYNSRSAADLVDVHESYIPLLIVMKHREPNDMETALCHKGTAFFEGITRAEKDYDGITIEQFFDKKKGIVPRTVILQGESGYGKTFTVQKIMHAWASGKIYSDFSFVFHLKMKELKDKIEESHSLVDLLKCDDNLMELAEKEPDKVLIIMDGFDELILSTEDTNTSPPPDHWTKGNSKVVLKALLCNEILQSSSLLVTTRSSALKALYSILKHPQRFTEILGFPDNRLETYFKAFYQGKTNPQLWEKALSHVKKNETLLTACFIPLTCWIIGTIFDIEFNKTSSTPSELHTNTSIFARFVRMQKNHHFQIQEEREWNKLLRNLSKIANDGLIANDTIKVFFDDTDVKQRTQSSSEIPFLLVYPLKGTEVKLKYCFMHLSFQEFFAALFYVLRGLDKGQKKLKKVLKMVQQKLHETDQKQYMSHVFPVIQFVFGLLNKEVLEHWKTSKSENKMSKIRSLLEKWIHKLIKEQGGLPRTHNIQLFILQCLYEVHEEKFVKKAMGIWNQLNLDGIPLKMADCSMLAYCMKHRTQDMERLILTHCNLTPEKLKVLIDALDKSPKLG